LIDTSEGKVGFYRNGKPVTAHFNTLPKQQEFYAVVSFYNASDTASIIPGKNLPTVLPRTWTGPVEKKKSRRNK